MTPPPDDVMELLTAYALGTLEHEELARVSRLLEEQPELRATLAELRAVVGRLPYALPEADLAPELRQRTLAHAMGRTAAPAPRIRTAAPNRMRAWLLSLGGLAAAAILAAVLGWVQFFDAQAQLTRTHAELAAAQAGQYELIAAVANPETLVVLTGDHGHGTLVRSAGSTMLMASLPRLALGRVYQLWFIAGHNAPVGAGTFVVDDQGLALLTLAPGQPLPAADTFAVTDEPAPGSQAPTTTPLIVGSVASA